MADWVPAGHLARLVDDLVENVLDLSQIYADYTEVRGAPLYDPRLLTKVILYGYAIGVFSSRRLERAVIEHVPFRYLSANQLPDHKTISDFRKRHLKALGGLFQVSAPPHIHSSRLPHLWAARLVRARAR